MDTTDVYFGRAEQILELRRKIKLKYLKNRQQNYYNITKLQN